MPNTIYSAIFNSLVEPSLILKFSESNVMVIDISLSFLDFFNLKKCEVVGKPYQDIVEHYHLTDKQKTELYNKVVESFDKGIALNLSFHDVAGKSQWNFENALPCYDGTDYIVLHEFVVMSQSQMASAVALVT